MKNSKQFRETNSVNAIELKVRRNNLIGGNVRPLSELALNAKRISKMIYLPSRQIHLTSSSGNVDILPRVMAKPIAFEWKNQTDVQSSRINSHCEFKRMLNGAVIKSHYVKAAAKDTPHRHKRENYAYYDHKQRCPGQGLGNQEQGGKSKAEKGRVSMAQPSCSFAVNLFVELGKLRIRHIMVTGHEVCQGNPWTAAGVALQVGN